MWESLPVFGVQWWEDPVAGSQLCPIATYSALYFLGQHKVAQDAPLPLPSAPRTATRQVCVLMGRGKSCPRPGLRGLLAPRCPGGLCGA